MAISNKRLAGSFLFVGVAQFSVFLIVAESLYPNYSVSGNYISDLGATCKSSCVFQQPSSTIFNSSIILLGLLLLASSYFLLKESRVVGSLVAISGIGCIGVGTFTEASGILHPIFSLITFVFIGLSAISAIRLEKSPMSYFSVIAGFLTLLSLILYITHNYLGLGAGGMERMIVYPVMVWALSFGGYLIGTGEK